MSDDLVKRLRAVGGVAAHLGAYEIVRLRAEVEKLRDWSEARASVLEELAMTRLRAEAAERKVEKLREALKEAIALRVKLYRNGDLLGEEDHVSDSEIARKETYARKWSAILTETEKPNG